MAVWAEITFLLLFPLVYTCRLWLLTSSWNIPQDFYKHQRAEELQSAASRGPVMLSGKHPSTRVLTSEFSMTKDQLWVYLSVVNEVTPLPIFKHSSRCLFCVLMCFVEWNCNSFSCQERLRRTCLFIWKHALISESPLQIIFMFALIASFI